MAAIPGSIFRNPKSSLRPRVLLAVLLCLLLAGGAGYALRKVLFPAGAAHVLEVPDGDREIAWLHTSTNGASWERFVAGAHRTRRLIPGLDVDDSRAFLDQTTAVPELVLSVAGRPGKLRVRWYKLTSDAGSRQWVEALAERKPGPLAIIGGGSSDRAVDLASALADQTEWHGARPLLLITTATADEVYLDEDTPAPPGRVAVRPPVDLMHVYPGRSFRFCFTNEQMAKAVIDFVWQTPDLRPHRVVTPGQELLPLAAVASPWPALADFSARGVRPKPAVFMLEWKDDPYSLDLCEQFKRVFEGNDVAALGPSLPGACRAQLLRDRLPFSVGSYYRPNRWEAEAAARILAEVPDLPGERSLLVLPTVAPPARRVLRALCGGAPLIGEHLVAVNGDGISFNTVYRDTDLAWSLRAVPVPLVLFTHQNPVDWDPEPVPGRPPLPFPLRPPTGTDDALLNADLVRVLVEAAYPPSGGGPVDSADVLAIRFRMREPAFFDPDGDRLGGSGEYVICLRPQLREEGPAEARVGPGATLEVWTRPDGRHWTLIARFRRVEGEWKREG